MILPDDADYQRPHESGIGGQIKMTAEQEGTRVLCWATDGRCM